MQDKNPWAYPTDKEVSWGLALPKYPSPPPSIHCLLGHMALTVFLPPIPLLICASCLEHLCSPSLPANAHPFCRLSIRIISYKKSLLTLPIAASFPYHVSINAKNFPITTFILMHENGTPAFLPFNSWLVLSLLCLVLKAVSPPLWWALHGNGARHSSLTSTAPSITSGTRQVLELRVTHNEDINHFNKVLSSSSLKFELK